MMGRHLAWLCALAASGPACKNKDAQPQGRGGGAGEAVAAADDAALAPDARMPEQVVLSGVVIKTVDPQDSPIDLMPRELARHVGALLTSKPTFVRSADEVEPGKRAREARLEIVVTYNVDRRPKQAAILCAVEAKLLWSDDGADLAPRENVIAQRPLSRTELATFQNGMLLEHVSATVAVAAEGIADKEELRGAPDAAIISALTGEDLDVAMWALDLVGERKLSEALDPVIATLGSKAPEVRDTAIGTLVALGDPRAVGALADLAEFSDHDLLRMVLEAVSAIGGKDALEFLEFIASGHPDEDIKARAQEGLDRLRRNPRAAR